ncbi:aminoacyl-tRNA hydrolase [Candidatus Merdisoma sp. JLR.KK006]|uniref:aminoacyl-tRNA hydrolase n=1 Tax=Candidatus Merdisoma sp. JLR.KK006 TaxID=3112626 RepID=UPI002FF1F762
MYIIAGLGNPTKKYEHTRHNIGFDVIDHLAEQYNISMNTKKFKGVCGVGTIEGNRVLLLKPQTFMNLSGNSVGEAVEFYKLDPARELIVIYDDIDLAPGNLRIRKKGSAGGHNGMKDIITHLGTQEFLRIRVGVGAKIEGQDLVNHVLGHFSGEDRKLVEDAISNAADAVRLMVQEQTDTAMNQYNKKVVKE